MLLAQVANERAAACDARMLAAERALDAVRLQAERDRGMQAGGSAAAELAKRELLALREQLEAVTREHRAQLESQEAGFTAELARSRSEARCEQQQLQAATVQALQAAATAGLAGRLAAAAPEVSARRATVPQLDGDAKTARRAEIRKLLSEAAAQLPLDELQLQGGEKRRSPTHTLRPAAANSRAGFK